MLDSKKALVSGSFVPPTIGHMDIVSRAAKIFDEVWVVAFVNASKPSRYTPEQILEMLKAAFGGMEKVHVDLSSGLLADFAQSHGIGTIVRGARSATDFDYEMSLSLINRSICSKLDTMIIPADSKYAHISSTMVSELVRYGKDFSPYVPDGVAELISRYKKEEN